MSAVVTMAQLHQRPVRELSPAECRRLLVHHHGAALSKERRRGLMLRSEARPEVYFNATEIRQILEWIDNEGKEVKP
jgi:hypothetical protein